MMLIVGLGNPGSKYENTRHNIGFLAVDDLALELGIQTYSNEFEGQFAKSRHNSNSIFLLKPLTYMNLSGRSVQKAMAYYKIPEENILVIHDDIDSPFGCLKFQKGRGHGGHNGIRNIHQVLGSKNYERLKIGVDKPTNKNMDVADYVLQDFNKRENELIPSLLGQCTKALMEYINNGFQKAATQFNGNFLEEK